MSANSCPVCRAPLPIQKAGQRRLYCSQNCRREVEFAHRNLPKMAFRRDELLRRADEVEAAYQAAQRGHRCRPFRASTADDIRTDAAKLEATMAELARSAGISWPPELAAAELAS